MNIEHLTDRLEVADLVTCLGRWLDGHGGDPATIYDRDVVARSPRGELHGIDEVVALVGRAGPAGERVQHFHTDILVEVDGDRARVTANQLVQFFQPGAAPHRTSGLQVAYEAVRREEGWRLSVLQIDLAWIIGTLPT